MRHWFVLLSLCWMIVVWNAPTAQHTGSYWDWQPFLGGSGPVTPHRHCVRTETYFHCWYE